MKRLHIHGDTEIKGFKYIVIFFEFPTLEKMGEKNSVFWKNKIGALRVYAGNGFVKIKFFSSPPL